MFFLRMIFRSFSRQLGRRMLIAVTVALSACVAVSMLGVVYDVGDKLNAELSTYGSNITVQPKSQAVVSDLYSSASTGGSQNSQSGVDTPAAVLKESDVAKIKTIFWAFNITDFAPRLDITAQVDNARVPVVGTWFAKDIKLDSGESSRVGMEGLRPWWKVQGRWPRDKAQEAMIGKDLAAQLGGKGIGDSLTLTMGQQREQVRIVGLFDSGDDDSGSLYMPTALVQNLAQMPGDVDRVEVKALTTPENDLARKAARNPAALTQDEWETWYCTAYPSSIAYQIEEVIPDSVAKQVRQVAALQGDVLQKTQAVMILMTLLSLLAAAVAVANLMASSISERSAEFALLKALGAKDGAIFRLVLAETALISLAGALVGALAGSGLAQFVGHVVFGSGITMRPMVFVLVLVLLTLTILLASLSSLRTILRLRPAEVLHGR
ncbi:ABC transporter permease [Bifidobacterium aemilianum]|uniref:ABC transporter permease n=1 Tax=Bifidobacterium aemilianum TaxID=2493120 RepID=A0A366K7R8_9BIFI|nr:ABC transporter permease [Bifidobacterium aemilianum]RBP97208.1 ABC transporter permease [Bifidobacterium aemilianum]